MMCLPDGPKSFPIGLVVLIQYRLWQTPTQPASHPASHVAVAITLNALAKASSLKTTWEVVSTCEVLWSARLNMSKVTENRLEDRSSQWEAMKRFMGLSTARWSTPTETGINNCEWWLFDILSASTTGVWVWTAEIETTIDVSTPLWRLKLFEDRSLLRSCEHAQLLAFARLQSLV